ncbi:GntR family transcriptional regulator [Curtobacterium sp. MCJR17_055]|uniref:GntR family transcriptional regulator n=1 Tax=unclassified Curtobacterium TaxID=257496 RepID=UPI000D99E34C|nr:MULTISPECIES: GntR family transcriptional regulator [unclassified Curtobacterium]PYY38081.1 GntR family transcriptional regulator [Curtobacterium sp. MCBD17_029]PYY57106.1 GntR family transcriptional regulator [Curtobacterium sp. MCJR17_055]PYY61978.1 GntR family transcriptional regulator [Curtobacterium sp. MCPF17_015]
MPVPSTQPAAERKLLRDTVQDKIRDAIMDGTLEPGERLNDDDLIAWLGVSRTPIREALAELARAGLVEMAPNRYTKVAAPSAAELLDAYQTLGVIYGGVVRLAVPRFTDAERRRVVRTLDDVLERLGEGQQAEVAHDGADLYAMWAEACGNASLAQLCRATTDGLAFRLRVPELAEVVPPEAVTPRVRELRDAVAANDPIAAELAMEAAHLLPTRN